MSALPVLRPTGAHLGPIAARPRFGVLQGRGAGRTYEPVFIPKIVCPPQPGEGDLWKIGIFAGIHGDEQALASARASICDSPWP